MSNLFHFADGIDPKDYEDIINIVDNFLFMQQLSGLNSYCEVKKDYASYLSKEVHSFRIWMESPNTRKKSNRITLRMFQDQTGVLKAKFEFSVSRENFNPKKFAHKLKRAGFETWDNRRGNKYYYYTLYCYDNQLQAKQAIEVFADYIT